MLKEMRIKNFKSLRDTGNLKIKPLTLLVGPNSSGKSSLIQFLLLLKQTVESRDIENPLILNGTCIQLESYRNIIYKNDVENQLDFEFSFDSLADFFLPWPSKVRYHVTFHIRKKEEKVGVACFEIINPESRENLSFSWDEKERKYDLFEKSRKVFTFDSSLRFQRFYPVISASFLTEKDFTKIEKILGDYLMDFRRILLFDRAFSKGICYLGPLREYPQRYYAVWGAIMEDVGFKGEKTIEVLATAEKIIHEKVQKWINIFDMAKSIKIGTLKEKGTLVEVLLEDSTLQMSFNLYDVGFGVSQVLPIIVEGFYAPKGSLILIEQPEIHLHPRLQAEMGDLLIEISRSQKKLIIETHSEHLLLRIQRRITEGTLKSSDVAIYFFTYTPEGTKIERINIDDLGRFENWPSGFFEEDVEESFAITKALISRTKDMGD